MERRVVAREASREESAEFGESDFAGGELAFFIGKDLGEVEEPDGGGVRVDLEELAALRLTGDGWSGVVALLSKGVDKSENLLCKGHGEVDGVAAGTLAGEEFVGGAVGLTHATRVANDHWGVDPDPGGFFCGNEVNEFSVGVDTGNLGELEAFAIPGKQSESAGFSCPAEINSDEAHTLLDDRTCDSL